MSNTITLQLNDSQYDDMMTLLDHALSDLHSDLKYASDDETKDEVLALLAAHESVTQELTSTKSYLWSDGYGAISLEIPAEVVEMVARSGDNLPAVEKALADHPYLLAQMAQYTSSGLEKFLDEAGIDGAHNMNIRTIHQHVLWLACWEIFDEQES